MTYCIFTDLRHFDVKSGNEETLGRLHDIYLDDETWTIKWFVVETGHWYSSNKVLLDSKYFTDVSPKTLTLHVSIGKSDIENAPSVEEHHPVSEQHQNAFLYTTFGHDTLLFPGYAGMIMPQTLIERSLHSLEEEEEIRHEKESIVSDADYADRHLRSASEILGYTVSATDGTLGPLTDLVINTSQWNITLMALDTSKWLPDRTVVVVPQSIERISWQDRKVFVNMDKTTIKNSPRLQDLKDIETSFVSTLSDYYLYPMV
jgi:sporulation protein YlmC with PRC-barrel domain